MDTPTVSSSTTTELLAGWGGTAPSAATVRRPTTVDELAAAVDDAPDRGVIARGLGRCYGDEAQNAGGVVIDATGVSGILELDLAQGTCTAAAGTSLDDLMRWLVPLGWFVPVTPGTRFVTVGGAIANDIHGKNHHKGGSWCNHVSAMTMRLATGETVRITPATHPELFWATAGGLGLTGVILDATFDLSPIETSRLLVDTDRTPDLDTTLALMDEGDDRYPYSVAWIDLMKTGPAMGRSILGRGSFAPLDALPPKDRTPSRARAFAPKTRATFPSLAPNGLINPLTVAAFNELWYRKAPKQRRDELQSITTFFHPLDMVDLWNRVYGPIGFLQWQFVLPFGEEAALRRIVEALCHEGCTSFLAVLKRFGAANPGHLSFPLPGWTLALDIPAGPTSLARLIDQLDDEVVAAGGRVYLAKDSRVRPELLDAMYPRLGEWRAVRADVDPDAVLQSDLARRLGL